MEVNNGSCFASHEHPLELYILPEDQRNQNCSTCKKGISIGEWIYTCGSCNYNFHIDCLHKAIPKRIDHPLHPQHSLIFGSRTQPTIFSSTPASISDHIRCGACGHPCSHAGHYFCLTCKFGTHISCFHYNPLFVRYAQHNHRLYLSSSSCSKYSGSTACSICYKAIEEWSWFYRCGPCNYNVHLDCGVEKNDDYSKLGRRGFPPLRLEARVNTSAKMVNEQSSKRTRTKYDEYSTMKVSELPSEITDLKAKYEDSVNMVVELRSEITDLKTKYVEGAKKATEMQNEITDLKTRYEDRRKLVMKVKIEK